MAIVLFKVADQQLTDKSEVFDVTSPAIVEADGVVWNAPSERTARLSADALNDVLEAFARCGSDYEALKLAGRIVSACNF